MLHSIITLVAAFLTPSANAAGPTFPSKFHGEWARVLTDCNSRGGENVSGLTVRASSITYYEETMELQQVQVRGDSLTYTGKLIWADGEDTSSGKLRLSSDGSRLFGASDTESLVRCPA
ncbi:hypothetical protein [Sphingomonas xinjiangensis]|uniref:Membrane-bound lysozyme-inhibitor of c-type lysozyme n=1 Tax=Sphingomonas xinjiangensis TaxID=643568 RepID=A0A840YRU4_9SPHN|nr:hypothetical protein [Sphingomonas xinjiangensis]MBB5712389.1 hypothetical protein [Sphingomonas xinjiangensis]